MANILRDVIQHGTGRAALKIGRDDLGGKTGTTNDAKDAWFAGFNGKLVAVAWVGFDQPRTLGRREYGGVAALPIWTTFMANALKDTPSSWVHLDKNAKDPISRDKLQIQSTEDKKSIAPLHHWLDHCIAQNQHHKHALLRMIFLIYQEQMLQVKNKLLFQQIDNHLQ